MATKETSGGERGKRAAIVFFFCGQMEAEYELAAKSLAEFGIRLGRVNGPAEKELADSLHVGAWPTLKVFRKGRSFDYRGASFFCFFVSLFLCFVFCSSSSSSSSSSFPPNLFYSRSLIRARRLSERQLLSLFAVALIPLWNFRRCCYCGHRLGYRLWCSVFWQWRQHVSEKRYRVFT